MLITGDTHRNFSQRIQNLKNFSGNSPIIVAGDFGLLWDTVVYYTQEERDMIKDLQDTGHSWLFVDGNHENFTRLNRLPLLKKYGAPVGVVADGIYHLRRGNVYTIEGKKIFIMGGAASIDKAYRIENISWWSAELPSKEEEDYALEQLDKVNWKVDYVITHAAPEQATSLLYKYLHGEYGAEKIEMFTSKKENQFLSFIADKLKFKHWYFGHYHFNGTEGKYTCLYQNIESILEMKDGE